MLFLAQGITLAEAVDLGKQYISRAIAHADELQVGRHGPKITSSLDTEMFVDTVGVQLSNATLRYRDSEHATLSGLSLSINAGASGRYYGRSGCGKTTVLRYLAGLLDDKVEWQGTLATSDELPLTDRIAYGATRFVTAVVVGYRQCVFEPSLSKFRRYTKAKLR